MPSASSVPPIISRKPSASMTMVGLLPMKRASGSAATIIRPTATSTAITMIGMSSVMPTAVMMLSSENTRSSSRIWPMTPATVTPATPAAVVSPGCSPDDIVVDLVGRLPDQEQAARDQDQVAPREAVIEQREQRRRELDDEGDAAEQDQPQDHRQADADTAGVRALCLRQLVGQDGDEDQVVDAEHDFHDDQRGTVPPRRADRGRGRGALPSSLQHRSSLPPAKRPFFYGAHPLSPLPMSPSAAPSRPAPTLAIVLLSVAAFASAANMRVIDPLLVQLGAEFGVTVGEASIAATAFLLRQRRLRPGARPVRRPLRQDAGGGHRLPRRRALLHR